MDIQRPIPRQKLRADWGRAVADVVRAQGLDGPGVLRTPGGTSLPPVQPPAVAQRTEPPPWTVLAAWKAGDGGGGDWVLRVIHGGPVTRGGAPVPAPAPTGSYANDRPGYTDVSRTAFGGASGYLVVEASASAQAWSLRRDAAEAGDGFHAVAYVSWEAGEPPLVTQLHHGPLELGGVSAGPDSDAVEVELDSSDSAYAHTDSWSYGDTATVPVDPEDPDSDTVEKKTYPKFTPFRLYWWEAQHKLLAFHRKVTTNPDGQITEVSAENPDTNPANSPIEVYTAVPEMP